MTFFLTFPRKNNLTYTIFTLIRVASHIIKWASFNAVLFEKQYQKIVTWLFWDIGPYSCLSLKRVLLTKVIKKSTTTKTTYKSNKFFMKDYLKIAWYNLFLQLNQLNVMGKSVIGGKLKKKLNLFVFLYSL